MGTPEGPIENQPQSIFEANRTVDVTIDGITLTLEEWFALCPKPVEELDPKVVDSKAAQFLAGKNPFTSP